jgi:hypothetical protein
MKRISIGQKIALVLFGFLPSIVAAQDKQAFGTAINGVRIGIFVKMVETNGASHPELHVITENTSNSSQNLLPATTWYTITLTDSSGKLIADQSPCPTNGNGEIPPKTENYVLAPGAQRIEDDVIGLWCLDARPGTYSVTLTSKIYPEGHIGFSNPLATVKSNTIKVRLP